MASGLGAGGGAADAATSAAANIYGQGGGFGKGFSMINGKKSKCDVYESTKENKRKPSYLGMFIYSYARKLMYQKLLSQYITLYMDIRNPPVWGRARQPLLAIRILGGGGHK